jgi:hypothetical protein
MKSNTLGDIYYKLEDAHNGMDYQRGAEVVWKDVTVEWKAFDGREFDALRNHLEMAFKGDDKQWAEHMERMNTI